MRASFRVGIRIVALAAVYFLTARLGLMLDPVGGFATLVWPPTGIALAALLLLGYGVWPGVALGAFFANLVSGAPVLVALGMASGNTLEAVLAAFALRAIPGFRPSLERLRDVAGLLVFAAVGSTMVSASLGAASLILGDVIPTVRFGATWRAWWLGDLVGDLIVAPLLLVWCSASFTARDVSLKRLGEAGALALSVVGIGLLSDRGAFSAYIFFVPLIWAALRFGQRGVVTTTFAVSVVAVSETAAGHGPFVSAVLSDSLFMLQAFMAVAASTFLILGAVLAELQESQRRSATIALENARLYKEERQARAAAEDAVRDRDAFLSVASHELRNPLGVLHLNLEIFEKSGATGDRERTAQTAIKIRRQVQRLIQLVDHLLDASRITAGRLTLEFEQADLTTIVRDVVSRFDESIRRAQCVIELRADTAVLGLWDPMRLEQITTNLLTNALKYGSGQPIEIRVEGDGERARLIVKDHGVGIAKEDQERIFEQYERAAAEQVSGLGLGLWIVRQIVAALGGSITVRSEPGLGSTFTVELPRRLAEMATQAKRAEIAAASPVAEQVLVVEDDPDALETVTEILRSHGYSVAGAVNGQEALAYLRRKKAPCVIVLDLMMPVMDGAEFLRNKKITPEIALIPVVVVSADGQLARKAAQLQVADYLAKPINVDRLLSMIERHCDGPSAGQAN